MSTRHRNTPKLPWRHIHTPGTGAAAARRKRGKAPRVTLSSVDDRTVVAPTLNTFGVESLFKSKSVGSDPLMHGNVGARTRYEAYIRSDAWRRSPMRRAELEASGGRCRLCARGTPEVSIEVHHNTYSRLGRELLRDLCTLCRDCHVMVTNDQRHRRYAGLVLPSLPDTPRVLARDSRLAGGARV